MRSRLRSYRLSPAGGGLLLVAAAAVAVLAVGPSSEQAPATVVLVVIVLLLIVQPGGTRAAWSRTLAERRKDFGPRERGRGGALESQDELDSGWQREPEHAEHADRDRGESD